MTRRPSERPVFAGGDRYDSSRFAHFVRGELHHRHEGRHFVMGIRRFLGWAIADEPLTPRMLAAAAIIVGAVALVTGTPAAGRASASSISDTR